ncbi:uncharacterized protein LOC113781050 [Coffea eugenioides]|uniref:Uncharacterized protein n=1 Tax=Coffea arabica TaxID=13443 RepID=A0A6P6TY32_COFAR|nr:uncharacterized protein LOC113705031 [Coffea arabica]XP_027182690.1 uncharacterized protein LOC113781050 [Coffea eugenioides]
MGNCLFGGGIGIGVGEANEVLIKVVNGNGGIMEFGAPITVEFITDEFPGHGIFRSHDLFWKPLAHHEVLEAGEYYLLPLDDEDDKKKMMKKGSMNKSRIGQVAQIGHVRSNSVPQSTPAVPYRMSFDSQGILKRSHTEVFSRSSSNDQLGGFWKVKLVISPQQLLEILAQEARTQELIESVRTVAKCRNGFCSSSMGFSDQWSLSSSGSSRNASSSKKDALLLDL